MKIELDEFPVFEIVDEGGISSTLIGEGRMLPLLVIDIRANNEIDELVNLLKNTPPGDSTLLWCRQFTSLLKNDLVLKIKFTKPMQLKFGIRFDVPDVYHLVDGIIQCRGFYLETKGKEHFLGNPTKGRILIEVPFMAFDKGWETLLYKTVVSNYRKKGESRTDAKIFAKKHIQSMREIWNTRQV